MIQANTKKIQDLLTNLDKNIVRVGVTKSKSGAHFLLSPARDTNEGSCVEIELDVDETESVYVQLGRGCYFDVPDAYSNDSLEYLLKILRACVLEGAEEWLRYKSGNVQKSKFVLLLDGEKTTLHYRASLFAFGGEKKYIKYDPYPLTR